MTVLIPKNDRVPYFHLNAYWGEQLWSLLHQLEIDPIVDGERQATPDGSLVQYLLDSTCKRWAAVIRSVIEQRRLKRFVVEFEEEPVDEEAANMHCFAICMEYFSDNNPKDPNCINDPEGRKAAADIRSRLIEEGAVKLVPKTYEERLCDAGCEDGEPLDQKVAECYLEIADFLEKCEGCELW